MQNGSKLSLLSDEKANVLDIRALKERGADLHREITNAVKDTQSVVIQQLPNVILMTPEQFDDLDPNMTKMYESNDRLYRTEFNIMEVRVSS